MADVLIVYATLLGHTRRIAERVAEELGAIGHTPTIAAAETAPPLAAYAAVIVGAPVRDAAFVPVLEAYVRDHARELARRPTALYWVCSPDEHDDRAARLAIDAYLRQLLAANRWQPDVIASFAGIRPYTHLGVAHRVLGQEAGEAAEGEAATDWDAVTGFVEAVAHHLGRSAGDRPGVSSTRPASA